MNLKQKYLGIPEEIFKSPLKLVLIIGLAVFLFELGLMFFLNLFPFLPPFFRELLDSLLLVILLAPTLFLLVFRPTLQYFNERKRLEEETLKFKLGIESSRDAIFVTNRNGVISYANPACEQLYGFCQQEMIGRTPRIFKSGQLTQDAYKEFWNTLLKKVPKCIEIVNKTKSGKLVTVDATNNPILDVNGAIIGFLGVHRDVTQRKQVELERQVLAEIGHGVSITEDLDQLLQQIHNALRKVVYAENCFFALHNPETGLFSFPYFVDQFDSPPQPVEIPRSCTAYVYRSGKSTLITPSLLQQLIADQEVELVGSHAPSWIGVPLQTSSRIIGVLVLQHYELENVYSEPHLNLLNAIASQVANVIERKRSEEKLGESLSLVNATLESTADGILVVDRHGKITNFNRKFIEFWKIPQSLLNTGEDQKLLNFVMDQVLDKESFIRKIEQLYAKGEETSHDIIEFKDGRVFERYSQSQRFEGKSVGRVWSFHDITKRVKTEKALLQNEARLRELNITKDKFFSIISHDLKSSFNSILGFSNLLSEQVREKNEAGIEEYADIIQNASERAMNLLVNLLEWSRTQTGRIDFSPEYVEIVSLIHEITLLFQDHAQQKSIALQLDLPQRLTLEVDKDMISSILRNLISNAIKFSTSGGHIKIKAYQRDHEWVVSVSDNGVGIKQESLEKLFRIEESFSTLGTENEKGTGLGLILCKEFIDKHRGAIWVESEPNKGSTFQFSLPIHSARPL